MVKSVTLLRFRAGTTTRRDVKTYFDFRILCSIISDSKKPSKLLRLWNIFQIHTLVICLCRIPWICFPRRGTKLLRNLPDRREVTERGKVSLRSGGGTRPIRSHALMTMFSGLQSLYRAAPRPQPPGGGPTAALTWHHYSFRENLMRFL